jgi:hypothetical protein
MPASEIKYRKDHNRSMVEVIVCLLVSAVGVLILLVTLKYTVGVDLLKHDTKSRLIMLGIYGGVLLSLWWWIGAHGVSKVGELAIGSNPTPVRNPDSVRMARAVRH